MRGLGITGLVVLFLIMFGVGSAYYEDKPGADIYNMTKNLVWNYSSTSPEVYENFQNKTDINLSQINSIRIRNIIHKFVDFIGFTMMEIAKWGLEWGFNHPEYNYMSFAKLLMWWFLILTCFQIVPISLAMLYLFWVVVHKGWTAYKRRGKN